MRSSSNSNGLAYLFLIMLGAALSHGDFGKLDKEELKAALQKLGFSWMEDDKSVEKVAKKGDKDDDGLIDLDEFKQLAPQVLRQNLMKLAKENGAELGFLS